MPDIGEFAVDKLKSQQDTIIDTVLGLGPVESGISKAESFVHNRIENTKLIQKAERVYSNKIAHNVKMRLQSLTNPTVKGVNQQSVSFSKEKGAHIEHMSPLHDVDRYLKDIADAVSKKRSTRIYKIKTKVRYAVRTKMKSPGFIVKFAVEKIPLVGEPIYAAGAAITNKFLAARKARKKSFYQSADFPFAGGMDTERKQAKWTLKDLPDLTEKLSRNMVKFKHACQFLNEKASAYNNLLTTAGASSAQLEVKRNEYASAFYQAEHYHIKLCQLTADLNFIYSHMMAYMQSSLDVLDGQEMDMRTCIAEEIASH